MRCGKADCKMLAVALQDGGTRPDGSTGEADGWLYLCGYHWSQRSDADGTCYWINREDQPDGLAWPPRERPAEQ